MDLQQLQAMGAIVPAKLVRREVKIKRPIMSPSEEWSDPDLPEFTGETADESITVFIRRGSSADQIELLRAEQREQPFVAIQRGVCMEDGKPLFPTLEIAMQVALWLAMPLFEAVTEVAGNGPKRSRRRTSSGAKSHSPSADEASTNGSTPSVPTKKPSGVSTEPSADR